MGRALTVVTEFNTVILSTLRTESNPFVDSTWQSRPMGTGMGTSDHIPATIRLFHENFWVLLGAMSNFCVQPRNVIERNWEPIPVSSADTMADRIQFWFNFYYNY